MQAITPAGLEGLAKYKYSSVDSSPLSNQVMHPFWNFCVKYFIPIWLAPNVLTFAGFLCLLGNYLVSWYYDPDLTMATLNLNSVPQYVWFLMSFAHFMSHTLDGCDGKQARKTGKSTPLGELMDHGLDSMAAWLQMITAASAVGVAGYPWVLYTITCGVVLSFYLTHWEKYNTGVLFLPWTYDASQLLVTSVYLLAGLFGTQFFTAPLLDLSALHESWTQVSILHIFIVTSYVSILMQPIQSVINIVSAPKRLHGFVDGFMPLVPLIAMFAFFTFWAYASPANLLVSNGRVLLTALGLAFSNLTCQLIVSQMTSQIHRSNNLILAPLPFIAGAIYWGFVVSPAVDTWVLYGYTLFAALLHVSYGVNLVQTICQHINIYCFSITSTPRPVANKKQK
ncbi:hypothetical protein CAOG_08392 [Capsaspora owczarzaki ATCC 30864]|uniref:Ethanolaminephosphotransferase n=1 Tax=Capsaspora owczarzaki (strain ATCC 30864) TaxID=595528 RepID=A0A0D2WI13_CAPO3|nr:hypothetical protein CAOG_08392 [Capsaspora owczarzaki ATCC 30864]KJE88503.1 hypothetical protein CAOG_008392 [Capsaspora owczarzaki ATCC 30864]|eukprot:XP_011269962.1 hypothetical protein CAOG_08392 [Capsaspora owczarzaki ATCC 30864]